MAMAQGVPLWAAGGFPAETEHRKLSSRRPRDHTGEAGKGKLDGGRE